jgi:hypothetical protein
VRRFALLLAALALAAPARSQEPAPEARGALAWIDSDRLDLVGILEARVPLAATGGWSVFVDAQAVTAIREPTANFTFLVEEVDYRLAFEASRPIGRAGAITIGAAERGATLVDDVGSARVRVATFAWEAPGFRRAAGPDGWTGRLEAGAVAEHRGLDAVATARGDLRYLHRLGAVRLGFDAAVDALIGDDGGTDLTAGPRLEFDLGQDRRAGLYARWLRGRNPLGLKTDGLVVGFDVAQGSSAGASRPTPPEVSGLFAGGAGDAGRGTVRLLVRVALPPFAGSTAVEAEVDGNVLTAPDGNDLYYLYDAGIARAWGPFKAGGWFYHRSNHLLNGVNPTVASINVLEGGIESGGWARAEPGIALGRAGGIDFRVRAGWLIDSSFGEDDRWHARAGARWASPAWGGAVRGYVSAMLERGDVSASSYAVGLLLPRGWDVRAEARHDEQLYSADRRALLGLATLYF